MSLIHILRSSAWTIKARDKPKKAFDTSWNALSAVWPQIWPQINTYGYRGHWRSCNFEHFSTLNNFLQNHHREVILPPSCSSRRDGSKYTHFDPIWTTLIFALRAYKRSRSFKVIEVGHVAHHKTRLDERNTMVLVSALYHDSNRSYSHLCACDLTWPQMTFRVTFVKSWFVDINMDPKKRDFDRIRLI